MSHNHHHNNNHHNNNNNIMSSNNRPSIFTLLSQDNLSRVVQPAVKRAVRVLAEQYPGNCSGLVVTYFNEVYACLDFIVQNYYLFTYGGSFSEQFYQMRRTVDEVNDEKPKADRFLPQNIHLKSLLFLVLVPYVREKWKLNYESFKDNQFQDRIHDKKKKKKKRGRGGIKSVKDLLASAFPHVNGMWELFVLLFELGYVFQQTRWSSPELFLTGVQLITDTETTANPAVDSKMGPNSFQNSSQNSSPLEDNTSQSLLLRSPILKRFVRFVVSLLKLVSLSLSTGLYVGVFFLQFLDYWYNTQNKSHSPVSLTALPIPAPPVKLKLPEGCSHSTCPLCKKTRTNDTVLSITGFVFCYPCIFDYINQHRRCPVTGFPSDVHHLVRLHPSD